MFMLFSFSFWFICLFFDRKLYVLLLMEVLFLCSFFCYFCSLFDSNSGYIFSIFILLIFLVLDSVTGVSLLVSIGRSSGPHSFWIY